MSTIPLHTKAILYIIFTILLVGFIESPRLYTLTVGGQDSILKDPVLAYTAFAANTISTILHQQTIQVTLSAQNPIQKIIPKVSYTKPKAPYRIIIVGDSFIAEKFGPLLEKELLSYQDTQIWRIGVYSTGLSRPDYFDWNEKIKELITLYQPNIVIAMFGANDGQDTRTKDGKVVHYDAPEWDVEYATRVSTFLHILQENKIFIFWIGNPIAKTLKYRNTMTRLNTIYEQVLKTYTNTIFISMWDTLKDAQGEYNSYLPDENGMQRLARASDGIHATPFGANIMVQTLTKTMKDHLQIKPIQLNL